MSRKTKLQKIFKDLIRIARGSDKQYTIEDYHQKLKEFGTECMLQAFRGKLIQVDYLDNMRKVKEDES
jgi:hypothetical protein